MSKEMAIERSMEARNKAGNYFKEGYNCSESIFLAFREYYGEDIDPKMVKLLTGFGGGLGESGCMCGALTSSVLVLNMIKGRTSNTEDRKIAYELAKEFHNAFEQKFGATCCRALNKSPFESKEHLTTCLKITGNTGKLLMEFIQEKGL